MNKFAEQFQNDVVIRYQQKMAALVKRAEEDHISKSNLQNYATAEDAAKAIDFEKNIFEPMVAANEGVGGIYPQAFDFSGVPTNLLGDIVNASAVAGGGIPDLRQYSNKKFLSSMPSEQLRSRPLQTQLKEWENSNKFNLTEAAKQVKDQLAKIDTSRQPSWSNFWFGTKDDSVDIDTPRGYPAYQMHKSRPSRSIRNMPTTQHMTHTHNDQAGLGPWIDPINMDEIVRKAYGF